MGNQQSKRMRGRLKIFRASRLITRCSSCGANIPNASRHHYLCQKCWNEKEDKTDGEG